MRFGLLRAACVALALSITTTAGAQMQHGGHATGAHPRAVAVENPWARASTGNTAAAYVTLVNRGGSDDRLLTARSGAAERVALHTHEMEGNIMRMRAVEAIPVPAGKSVTLRPGGYHVMMMGLRRKLGEGDSFPLTLVMEKAGEITVDVPVIKMGAMGPGTSHGHGHGGMRH